MEHIHGVDVSWMAHAHPKGPKLAPATTHKRASSTSSARPPSAPASAPAPATPNAPAPAVPPLLPPPAAAAAPAPATLTPAPAPSPPPTIAPPPPQQDSLSAASTIFRRGSPLGRFHKVETVRESVVLGKDSLLTRGWHRLYVDKLVPPKPASSPVAKAPAQARLGPITLQLPAPDPPSPVGVIDVASTANSHPPEAPSREPPAPESDPQLAMPQNQAQPTRPVTIATAKNSGEERRLAESPAGTPPRRGSWFSNISSKFSSSNSNTYNINNSNAGSNTSSPNPQSATTTTPPQTTAASPKPAESAVPKSNPPRNAVLQHAARHNGESPYTPAPPKGSTQGGILHVLRKLSSSAGTLSTTAKSGGHGLVERRVLNVDSHRERCCIAGLNHAKLRRVAFCVDVEIAPMPRYADQGDGTKKAATLLQQPTQSLPSKKISEKGEGDALKGALKKGAEHESERRDGAGKKENQALTSNERGAEEQNEAEADGAAAETSSPERGGESTKKKDKKKKSEEERKARKEKKRKLAEVNGSVPLEIHVESDSSSSPPDAGERKTDAPASIPTRPVSAINPVRIYRRCCQLRESPILKRITEQLSNEANCGPASSSPTDPGCVEKLDLTGYWLQLADLITLGDYLAVVPVREVILENCGLTDEGLRVVLAGLLATKKGKVQHRPRGRRKPAPMDAVAGNPDGLTRQGGTVERLVLKNNKNIGAEGWRHLCLFIYMCRTLKALDLAGIPFPQPRPTATKVSIDSKTDLCRLLSTSIGQRLGGNTLGLLTFGESGFTSDQLGLVVDGLVSCGVRRLGLSHNKLDDAGMQHVFRYLDSGLCEGLDLGGNDLRGHMADIADRLDDSHPLWALGLADCNLVPSAMCKLLPRLVRLEHFRFIDLSLNPSLFRSETVAIAALRRWLPKMRCLKRIHLSGCSLTSDQVIALAEIIPEIPGLAHINLQDNSQLAELITDAKTEEQQEEACALFASLVAAARSSTSLVAVDIEVPSEASKELVKAMAKQVIAYCLRNMERVAMGNLASPGVPLASSAAAEHMIAQTELSARHNKPGVLLSGVLQHLVGHDVLEPENADSDVDSAPDDDFVVGGTGIVKALTCVLENRADDDDIIAPLESTEGKQPVLASKTADPARLPATTVRKAKETSKHLLMVARKIRHRMEPALMKAKCSASSDLASYHRLLFLDNTLKGIIERFEDEFPECREEAAGPANSMGTSSLSQMEEESSIAEKPPTDAAAVSDDEDDVPGSGSGSGSGSGGGFQGGRPSRPESISSRTQMAAEEGRILRAGQKLRSSFMNPIEDVGDENYLKLLSQMAEAEGEEGIGADGNDKDRQGEGDGATTGGGGGGGKDPSLGQQEQAGDKEDENGDDGSHDDNHGDGLNVLLAGGELKKHARILHEMLDDLDNADHLRQEAREKGAVRVFRENRRLILDKLQQSDPVYWERFVESQQKARANIHMARAGAGGDGSEASESGIVGPAVADADAHAGADADAGKPNGPVPPVVISVTCPTQDPEGRESSAMASADEDEHGRIVAVGRREWAG